MPTREGRAERRRHRVERRTRAVDQILDRQHDHLVPGHQHDAGTARSRHSGRGSTRPRSRRSRAPRRPTSCRGSSPRSGRDPRTSSRGRGPSARRRCRGGGAGRSSERGTRARRARRRRSRRRRARARARGPSRRPGSAAPRRTPAAGCAARRTPRPRSPPPRSRAGDATFAAGTRRASETAEHTRGEGEQEEQQEGHRLVGSFPAEGARVNPGHDRDAAHRRRRAAADTARGQRRRRAGTASVPALEPRPGSLAQRFAQALPDWHPAAVFLVAAVLGFALLAALSVAFGLLLTDVVLRIHPVAVNDERFVNWLVGDRTSPRTEASLIGLDRRRRCRHPGRRLRCRRRARAACAGGAQPRS